MAFIRLDGQAVANLLNSPTGPAARHAIYVGDQLKQAARPFIGRSPDSERGGKHLQDSLVSRLGTHDGEFAVLVGSSEPHAWIHHDDTKPHEITPKNAKALRFPTQRGGSVFVFAKRVMHPGTKGTKYLERAALSLGLRFRRIG